MKYFRKDQIMPSLDIEPKSELKFKGPFNDIVTSEIIATNHTQKTICFKVKTTAPKQYCVRPNCGYVEPGQTVAITIMLQPIDLTSNEKLKHKFLIQSLEVTPPYPENPELVWKTANSENIGEHKLKCVFDVEVTHDERSDKKRSIIEHSRTKDDEGVDQQMVKKGQSIKSLSLMTALAVIIISIILGFVVGKFILN